MRFIITLECKDGHKSTQAIDAAHEDAAHEIAIFMVGGKTKGRRAHDMPGHTCGALQGGRCSARLNAKVAKDDSPPPVPVAKVDAAPSADVRRGMFRHRARPESTS